MTDDCNYTHPDIITPGDLVPLGQAPAMEVIERLDRIVELLTSLLCDTGEALDFINWLKDKAKRLEGADNG